MILEGAEERQVILKLWDQHQDTWQIGRLLQRKEHYIERQLHAALDSKWVKGMVIKSLRPQ